MLKKLTSPRNKAPRAGEAKRSSAAAEKELRCADFGRSGDEWRSVVGLASIPNDGDAQESNEATPVGDAAAAKRSKPPAGAKEVKSSTSTSATGEKKAAKKRDDLSIDLNALTESTSQLSKTSLPSEASNKSFPTDANSDRRKTLLRSPRTKNILDEGEAANKPDAEKKTPKSEAAKSPRKEAKKKPVKKGGSAGFKAFKSSKSKEDNVIGNDEQTSTNATGAAATDRSLDDDADKASKSSTRTQKSKPMVETPDNLAGGKDSESNRKGSEDKQSAASSGNSSKRKPDQPEANLPDQQEERDEHASSSDTNNSGKKSGSTKQAKSSLSPLRRRQVHQDSDATGLGGLKELPGRRLKLRDLPPANQPEVHVIGEITSGDGFGSGGFACKWGIEYGSMWHHIAGDQLGQTQIDYPSSASQPIIWSHPLDLHFATSTFQGWPKLLFQVWRIDTHMKPNVAGYGFIHLPFSPGEHHLSVALWRPMGSTKEELAAKFLGQTPELVTDEVVFNSAWAERCRLQTIATGRVHLRIGILLRNFQTPAMELST